MVKKKRKIGIILIKLSWEREEKRETIKFWWKFGGKVRVKVIGSFGKKNRKKVKLSHMPIAQEWLDANYPNKEARRVQLVDLTGLNLTGDLDVTDFFTTDWDYDRERETVKGTKFIITGNPQLRIIDRKE